MRQHRERGAGLLAGLLLAGLLLTGTAPAARAAEPTVKAAGAIVMDFETEEVYYEKNADVARPIASMTKVMSLYLVFEDIAAGNLSLDSYVTASPYASAVSNDGAFSGLERLRAGEQYQVDTLIRLIATESCNGSLIALAEHLGGGDEAAFVQRMNEKAAQWGIEAHFADACGFQDTGNAVTPRAMAYMAKRIITDHPQILEYTSLPSTQFQGRTFYSTNTLLRNGSCEGIDGLKTGTTGGAGYCFTGTAQRNGRRIISVVMNSAGYTTRMSESKTLLEYGFACRAERERRWAAGVKGLEVEITARDPLWSRVETELFATVKGPEEGLFGTLSWEIDGQRLGEGGQRWLKNGERLSFPLTAPEGEAPIKAALILTLPDGTEIRREAELARPEEDMGFVGRLGLRQMELYPETTVRIPLRVSLNGTVRAQISAGWYLDGEPIPGYQNDAFLVGPEVRTSGYTLRGEELEPGWHSLEFRCNTQGIPGIQQAGFSAQLLVIGDEARPAASQSAETEGSEAA